MQNRKNDSIPVSKNDISQYVRGITEPKQDKLTILGLALDVSEVWLMGYNVPQSREDFNRLSELPSNVLPVAKKRLPMLGNIACGEPTYAEEDWEGFVEVGADINADFCIRAKGDSMIGARILTATSFSFINRIWSRTAKLLRYLLKMKPH